MKFFMPILKTSYLIEGQEVGEIIPFPVWIILFPVWKIPFPVFKTSFGFVLKS